MANRVEEIIKELDKEGIASSVFDALMKRYITEEIKGYIEGDEESSKLSDEELGEVATNIYNSLWSEMEEGGVLSNELYDYIKRKN